MASRPEVTGQQRGGAVPDQPDGHADDEAPQLAPLAGLDAGEEVVRGLLGHPLERDQLFPPVPQEVEIGEVLDHAFLEELVDEHLAEPFDVHRFAPGEVLETLFHLGWAGQVRAPPVDLALRLRHRRPTDGALGRR
jgi:hypothetical protein